MQKKESKTNVHFYFSVIKSIFRIVACLFLFSENPSINVTYYFAGGFIIAELLGIAEEIF
jgi:hypothetical protein